MANVGIAQVPIDLFPDVPALGSGFIRIGSWNLRHINLESGAEDYLPGNKEDEDFAILIATFGKAITDLGLDLVAIVELPYSRASYTALQTGFGVLGGSA